MKYLRPIDSHVHLRGEEYPDIDYFTRGFADANAVGLAGLLEMPNPKPPIVTEEAAAARLGKSGNLYNDFGAEDYIYHGINIGVTHNMFQIGRAIGAYLREDLSVSALKIYFTHSTGNMGILDEDLQREIWTAITKTGYKGPVMGHFEDERHYFEKFDPAIPATHSLHQSEEAELVSVIKQLKNAVDVGFEGIFYVCHVSNPETVLFLERERKGRPFEIVCEATFHHLFLNMHDYHPQKNRIKMNPPVRNSKLQEQLLAQAVAGMIQVIGTDHAPHPVDRKDSDNPPSGIPALPLWPRGIQLLREEYNIPERVLENLIFNNANRIFKLGLKHRYVEREYDPSRWEFYGYNPFARLG